MSGPGEVVGLNQSIAYAEHLAAEAGLHGPGGNESYLQHLAAARVTGDGLASARDMQDAFATAAAAADAHAAHLAKQVSVQEAYDQAPDAGDKAYLTGDTGGAAPAADVVAEQGKEPPVPVSSDDDAPDQDEALFEQATAFIAATISGHPQQSPPGQDLQHRPIDGDEDETPWMSLPVRSPGVCEHVETACPECLDSWWQGHDLRIAAVPVAVDVDTHHGTADEHYIFEGDSERQLPPYWVARHGCTVTSQIEGRPVRTILMEDGERASATFAGECCDTTPAGPGAPRAGDRIELLDENAPAGLVTVTASTASGDGYAITGVDHTGQPVTVQVGAWNYAIVRRPAGAGR